MNEPPATRIVRLTPEGRGAVAVLLVAGPEAAEQVDRHFVSHSAVPLAARPLDRIWHGHWGTLAGEDVVLCRRSETELEVHCHGGNAAAERIIADLTATGCSAIDWREWTSRGEPSRIRAEALALLAEARTERTVAILLDQYLGALDAALEKIIARFEAGDAAAARADLQALVDRSSIGLHLVQPWRVVLAGPPNVGKSSLINALVGYRRSIVFDQPGTTRDVVSVTTALEGWPIELSDTAGLRPSDDPLESAGINLARRQLASADCIVLVLDATARRTAEFDDLICQHPAAIVVFNKADLLNAAAAVNPFAGEAQALLTSAVTGLGIDQLAAAIVRRLIPQQPQPGDAIPFTAHQAAQLRAALDDECAFSVSAVLNLADG